MPRRIALVLALMMVCAAAFAQISAGNVYLGYSNAHANSGWTKTGGLQGWDASVEGKVAPFAGAVVEVSSHYGVLQIPSQRLFGGSGTLDTQTGISSYMFGPRFSFGYKKFRPFAQALVGEGHLHEAATEYSYSESCVADAFGGGVDYHITSFFGLRAQGDLFQTRFHGGRQENSRISTGFVLSF